MYCKHGLRSSTARFRIRPSPLPCTQPHVSNPTHHTTLYNSPAPHVAHTHIISPLIVPRTHP